LLADAESETRKVIIAEIPKLESEQFKSVVVRLMLMRPDPASTADLIAATQSVSVEITNAEDPLLQMLLDATEDNLPGILAMLGRADLTMIEASPEFNRLIDDFNRKAPRTKTLQQAIIDMATNQFKRLPYETPLPEAGAGAQRGGHPEREVNGFESLLANIAADPSVSSDMAWSAASALIGAGRVHALSEALSSLKAQSRRQDIIRSAARDPVLRDGQSLPIFLTSILTGNDAKAFPSALAALQAIRSALEPKNRWLINLSIKQTLTPDEIVKLSLDQDSGVAGRATTLITQLARMTEEQTQGFRADLSQSGRIEELNQLSEERKEKLAGTFRTIMYFDLEPVTPPGRIAPAGGQRPRRNMPLIGPTVHIERSGSRTNIVLERINIGMKDRTAPADQIMPAIGIKPLLEQALREAAEAGNPLTDQIDPNQIDRNASCSLKEANLGTWQGETIPQARQTTNANKPTMTIKRISVWLEPASDKG
jgi:hypothetical protein